MYYLLLYISPPYILHPAPPHYLGNRSEGKESSLNPDFCCRLIARCIWWLMSSRQLNSPVVHSGVEDLIASLISSAQAKPVQHLHLLGKALFWGKDRSSVVEHVVCKRKDRKSIVSSKVENTRQDLSLRFWKRSASYCWNAGPVVSSCIRQLCVSILALYVCAGSGLCPYLATHARKR